jgi:hypothetical protein
MTENAAHFPEITFLRYKDQSETPHCTFLFDSQHKNLSIKLGPVSIALTVMNFKPKRFAKFCRKR